MHGIRKTLTSSGSHFCSAKAAIFPWSTSYFLRHLSLSARLHYSSLSGNGSDRVESLTTTSTTATAANDTQDRSCGSSKDAFSNPSVMQEVKERWGLGGAVFAHIVFPNGRAEIVDQTKKLTEARISRGYSGQQIPMDIRNTLREQQSREARDFRFNSKSSTLHTTSPNPHLHRISADGTTELMPQWMKHKLAIKKKLLGKAWNPQRKLTRQAMEEVRLLHKQFPDEWTTPKLAEHFNVASESIVKILKTNFQLPADRIVEQDRAKQLKKKENVSADVERMRAERHTAWLERKAEREKNRQSSNASSGRIKLGAPKRTIK